MYHPGIFPSAKFLARALIVPSIKISLLLFFIRGLPILEHCVFSWFPPFSSFTLPFLCTLPSQVAMLGSCRCDTPVRLSLSKDSLQLQTLKATCVVIDIFVIPDHLRSASSCTPILCYLEPGKGLKTERRQKRPGSLEWRSTNFHLLYPWNILIGLAQARWVRKCHTHNGVNKSLYLITIGSEETEEQTG